MFHVTILRYCECRTHFERYYEGKTPYRWDEVPIEEYIVYRKGKPTCQKTRKCRACREHRNKKRDNRKEKIIEKWTQQGDNRFLPCMSEIHSGHSKYLPWRVPRNLLTDGDTQFVDCSDCRSHNNFTRECLRKYREGNLKDNQRMCARCKGVHCEEYFRMHDGNGFYRQCPRCRMSKRFQNRRHNRKRRTLIDSYMLKKAIEIGGCCEICKRIFLEGDTEDGLPLEIINTYYDENVGARCLYYDGEQYEASSFIQDYIDSIDFSVIDCDHIPMEEMLRRGLIDSPEEHQKKMCDLARCCLSKIPEEINKCQFLCHRCHVIVTTQRQKGEGNECKETKQKHEYTNMLKAYKGCEICGDCDPSIPEYFEFDHKDPTQKCFSIADGVQYGGCSIWDLINECNKCRVLCGLCHRGHTANQNTAKKIALDRLDRLYIAQY